MSKRILFFEEKGKTISFRVIGTKSPIEEVSGIGNAKFEGQKLRIIWTARIQIGKEKRDRITSRAIIAAKNGETASYTSAGGVTLGDAFRQEGNGSISFSSWSKEKRGKLSRLTGVKGTFKLIIDEYGRYSLKVYAS
jgi:hypothetical protein